jgi:hypothetical protein
MRKPALPPSAFLLDMADARLGKTLCRSPQKKEKKKKSQSLQSLSVAVAAVVRQDLPRHFAHYRAHCSAGDSERVDVGRRPRATAAPQQLAYGYAYAHDHRRPRLETQTQTETAALSYYAP